MNRSTTANVLDRLVELDLAVLDNIERYRLLTSSNLQALHFAADRTPAAAARACNRLTSRLRRLGLLDTLERRVGGVRRGSAGLVWYLTDRGARLQQSRRGEPAKRRRLSEPSHHFVAHTLATTNVAVEVVRAARSGRFELLRLETEPANWQASLSGAGVATWLKPDLLVVVASGEYEQHWFIEVDLDTEHLPVIRRQRDAYHQHRASGRYQAAHGVYPAVLWIAPSERRAAAIANAVTADELHHSSDFQVATSADFLGVLSRTD